jgi:outer membrane protein
MRRPLDAPLELADVQEITAADFDLDNATNQALEQRPEIHLAEIQIDVNRKNVQMARSDYYPVVSVQYQNTQAGDHPGLGGSQFTEAWQWNVAAVASWRFWDWGETYHDVQAKKRDVNIAQNDLKLLKDAVKLEVKQAYLNMNASKKNISVAKKAVEQAEESYRMSYERYREQVATNTELLDAETDLTQARINYYTALYDFNTDVAALQRAIGVDYYAAPPAPVEPAEEDSEPRGQ